MLNQQLKDQNNLFIVLLMQYKLKILCLLYCGLCSYTGSATTIENTKNIQTETITDQQIIDFLTPIYYDGKKSFSDRIPSVKRYPHPENHEIEAIDYIDEPNWWTRAYVIGTKEREILWSADFPQYGASVEKIEWRKSSDRKQYLLYIKTTTHMGQRTHNVLKLENQSLTHIKKW